MPRRQELEICTKSCSRESPMSHHPSTLSSCSLVSQRATLIAPFFKIKWHFMPPKHSPWPFGQHSLWTYCAGGIMLGAFDAEMTETTFLPLGAVWSGSRCLDSWRQYKGLRVVCPESNWNGGGHQEKRTEEVT